jgi:exopolysaccharide biosynthesis polyprenyl glycosylphosphotransferase
MKRAELLFNLFSIPVDALFLIAAGVVSFFVRSRVDKIEYYVGPVNYNLNLDEFLHVMIWMAPVLIAVFAVLGLYNLKGTRRFVSELARIAIGTSLGLLLIVLLFFFDQSIFPSRFIILATWFFSTLFVWFGRYLLKLFQVFLFQRGYGLHKLLLVNGQSVESEAIMRVLNNKRYGYKVVGEIDYTDTAPEQTIALIEKLYSEKQFDELMVANPQVPQDVNSALVELARNKGLQFSFVPNLFEVQRNVIELGNFSGIPVISLKNSPLDGWGKVLKRSFDIVSSFICLLITLPLYAIIFVAIKLDSKGPAIYKQTRGGYQKDFEFYKFRSMHTHMSDGDEYGGAAAGKIREELWKNNTRGGVESPFLKIKNDPRVTRVGRIIRKTKLDELPQFWNVLLGHMSMVGPRAHMIEEVLRYREAHRRMFSVKPGIFGLSQNAQMLWPDLPFQEEIKINTFYIENWSLWLDVKILAKSFYLLFFASKPNEDY